MRGVWALLPLFASSGCLFLDAPNHPPSVEIQVATQHIVKGAPLAFHAMAADAEDGTQLTYGWEVTAADGLPFDLNCDVSEHRDGADDVVTFFRTGTFEVTATANDSDHASNHEGVMITVDNAPPYFTGAGSAAQSTSSSICGNNSAGQSISVHLDGGAADDDVLAGVPGCKPKEALTYTWRLTDWPSGDVVPVLTPFAGGTCAAPVAGDGTSLVVADAMATVCVKTNSQPGTYTVELDVSDDGNLTHVASHAALIAVGPDQPPCITGTEPIAGSYVVDRTQPQSFYVDGALDDLDGFDAGISYVWSVYRYADGSWRDVPSWNLSTYTLDLSSFGVGEKLRVRVEALDRTQRRDTTCDKSADDCTPSSCVANVCHKWKTWDLELR